MAVLLIASGGCNHTTPFAFDTVPSGPFTTGADVQLTYSPDQDYWPALTEDGRGLLYAFVDPQVPQHRCLGMLPAAGGTRVWELCDNRAIRTDSASSFEGFALDSSGTLLASEAVSTSRSPLTPPVGGSLWLADTSAPIRRRTLLTLPTIVDGNSFSWLSEIAWISPGTFVALGSNVTTVPHCVIFIVTSQFATQCHSVDTNFTQPPSAIVEGVIGSSGVTLHIVPGTSGATDYSLAESGATFVFVRNGAPTIYRMPVAGGTPTAIVTGAARDGSVIAGISCRNSTCVYAHDSVSFDPAVPTGNAFYFDSQLAQPHGAMTIHRLSLSSGADQVVVSNGNHLFYADPQLGANGDVVLQAGAGWGHLKTFATNSTGDLFGHDGNSTIHLVKGLAP